MCCAQKGKGMIVSATEAFVSDRANNQMSEGLSPIRMTSSSSFNR
jgi:hypothetical protein